jgi:hypothetical protein
MSGAFRGYYPQGETMNPKITPAHDARPAPYEVRILVKDQYGATVMYPHNANAQHFADIAGTKTITPQTLALIRKLGFTVVGESRPVVL